MWQIEITIPINNRGIHMLQVKKCKSHFPWPGIKPSPLYSKFHTLLHCYKSWLEVQGSTSVLYTYTLRHSPPPNWNSYLISRSPRITWNETKGVLCTHVGYVWKTPNVTGEKCKSHFPWLGIGVSGFDPHRIGNILSWKLIMKYFLQSFSP